MIYMLSERATSEQMQDMLQQYNGLIKIVVDIRRGLLTGGSEMHYECEEVLLNHGSEQDDLWGANWLPETQEVEFESLINIRPRLGNRSMIIQNADIRARVESTTRRILEGVTP